LCLQESANRPYRELVLCSVELNRRFLKYLLNITFSHLILGLQVLFSMDSVYHACYMTRVSHHASFDHPKILPPTVKYAAPTVSFDLICV